MTRTRTLDEQVAAPPPPELLWFQGEGRAVDAALVHDGHLLLIARRDGGGWALPGGFMEPGESDAAAMFRELLEETGVDASTPVGARWLGERFRTDDPRNTADAFITTRVALVRVPIGSPRPDVAAADDAADALWVPLGDSATVDRWLRATTGVGLYQGHGRLVDLVHESTESTR